MTDTTKTAATATPAPTTAATTYSPVAVYTPPAAIALGALEQVQANLLGKYYDGPGTSSWYRY